MNVASTNDSPVAVTENVSTNEDMPLSISVLNNDYDPDGTSQQSHLIPKPLTVLLPSRVVN